MKVIDMLNKIANGEKVKFKILNNDEIRDEIFEVENGHLRNSTCGKWLETKVSHDTWESISSYFLNKKVEIIEEEKKIPEKINKIYNIRILDLDKPHTIKDYDMEQLIEMVQDIYDKQDDIIDYLQSKGENND